MNIKINNVKANKEQKIFVSSDLALTAAISLHFPIINIDRQNPRKAIFIFYRNESLSEIVDKYWNKELHVEPRQYFDQLKALKARLYGNE